MKFLKFLFFVASILIIYSCATTKLQIAEGYEYEKPSSEVLHSFYLMGDAGGSDLYSKDSALAYLQREIKFANKNSTLIYLGDNVYEKGIPEKKKKQKYKLAKHRLDVQIDIAKEFPGKTIFIPGNHDWYSGLDGLKRQEKLVEDALKKKSFEPDNGCPLERVEINDEINVIIVDSHWYITNWDKHPGINDECEIKTREKFFEEFEGEVKKSQGKTTIVAIHHPMFTNGAHGGYYSFKSHMKPAPILGTIKNVIRKTSGAVNVDQQNNKYNDLRKRLINIAQQNERVIFVSGHEHSLQYIFRDNVPQIVSGSGSKNTGVKNVNSGIFGYGQQGFARMDVYKDGAVTVHFYSADDQKIVFDGNVFKPEKFKDYQNFPNAKLKEKAASVYTKEEVDKSKIFEFIWGKRYRKYFGKDVVAPTVKLDTLFGGVTPVRRGGGHQSESLRLRDKQGREYVMRALRKNATQYLQAVLYKDQYVEGQFEETLTEDLLMDVFTGSHPYAPFTVGTLADAIDVYHTTPVLYFVPKQEALKEFNKDYGDKLYMIEERADEGHGDKKNFGYSNNLISTDDLRKNLAKDSEYILDQKAYIRARLFDMLIGDWDRHQDQWRWAEFKKGDKTIYRPVPRDRDQAYSVFGSGFLLKFLTNVIPGLRGMRSYSEDLKSPNYFSYSAYPLDIRLITEDKEAWDEQVALIQNQITDEVIDDAFLRFPKEVRDETIEDIKTKLKGRRKNLQKIADKYYYYLNDFQVIRGTNKDDWFDIERFLNGDTEITISRIIDGKKADLVHKRRYKKGVTNEIWIYGLDDDDVFKVNGYNRNNSIDIKIIGGLGKDKYDFKNPVNIKVYDHKSKKNTFVQRNIRKKLTDNYETNTYNYKKLKNNTLMISPKFGFNPDDGIKIGAKTTFINNGFERNPFAAKHVISGGYFFATSGFELNYSGEFANVFENLNFGIDVNYNSPNFARNFFGFGNNSPNTEAQKEEENFDFNRVKISKFNIGTFLKWRGELGAILKGSVNYKTYQVENTPGRFIGTLYNPNNRIFDFQQFINTEGSYYYAHTDSKTFPTLAMELDLKAGFTSNLNEDRAFSYTKASLGLAHKLIPNGKLVLATKAKVHFIFGNDFEFFQGANIGGNEGLRGFRNERFTGKNSFFHSSDIRWNISKVKTGLIPLSLGLFGGFDYGKVWGTPNTIVTQPTFNNSELHTSYGGGIILNAANMISGSLGLFTSEDGPRFTFNLGFDF